MDSDFLAFYLNAAGGAAENRPALDSPDFDPAVYVDELVRQKSLKEIEATAADVHAELLDREAQLHAVVRRNCSRLASNASAASEISDLTEQLRKDLDTTLGEYSKFESRVSALNAALGPSLQRAKAALRLQKEAREFDELQSFCADLEFTAAKSRESWEAPGPQNGEDLGAVLGHLARRSGVSLRPPAGRETRYLSARDVEDGLRRFSPLLISERLSEGASGPEAGRVGASASLLAASLFIYLASLPERGLAERSSLLRALLPSNAQFTAVVLGFATSYLFRLADACRACLDACDEACAKASQDKGRLAAKRQTEISQDCVSKARMSDALREPLLEVQMVMGELGALRALEGQGLVMRALLSKRVFAALSAAASSALGLAGRLQAADRIFSSLGEIVSAYSEWAAVGGAGGADGTDGAGDADRCVDLFRTAAELAFGQGGPDAAIALVPRGGALVLSDATVPLLLSCILKRVSTPQRAGRAEGNPGVRVEMFSGEILSSPPRSLVASLRAALAPTVSEFCASAVHPLLSTLISSSLDTYASTMSFAVRATLSFKGCASSADEGANGLIADSVQAILKKEEQRLSAAFFDGPWFHEIWAEALGRIEEYTYHDLAAQILQRMSEADPPCNRYVSAVIVADELYHKSFGLEIPVPEAAGSAAGSGTGSTSGPSAHSGTRGPQAGAESRARRAMEMADTDWDQARLASRGVLVNRRASSSGEGAPGRATPDPAPQTGPGEVPYFFPALRKAAEIGILRGNARLPVRSLFYRTFDPGALLAEVEPQDTRPGETAGLVRYLSGRLPACLARAFSNALRLMAFAADETHGELVYGVSDLSYIQERVRWLGPSGWLGELPSLVAGAWLGALAPLRAAVCGAAAEEAGEEKEADRHDDRHVESDPPAAGGYAGETSQEVLASLAHVLERITGSLRAFSGSEEPGEGEREREESKDAEGAPLALPALPEAKMGVLKCLKFATLGYLGLAKLGRESVPSRSACLARLSDATAALLGAFAAYSFSPGDLENPIE